MHKGNTYVKISLGGSGYGSNRRPWVLDTDDKRAAFIALGKAAVDRLC